MEPKAGLLSDELPFLFRFGWSTVGAMDVVYIPVSLQDSWTCSSMVLNSQLEPS